MIVKRAGAGHQPLTTVATLTHLHEANVVAPTLLTRAALPHLRDRRGAVVNVSSTFGHRPTPPGAAHYGASKVALEALTRSWSVELAPMGSASTRSPPGPPRPRSWRSPA